MAFLDFIFGKKEKKEDVPLYTPQQENVLNQLLGQSSKQLPDVYNFLSSILSQSPEAMEAFERPALRQFEEQILPSIAERFTGQFGSGSQRSSAFGQQLGKAGASLSENLSAQRAGLGLNAIDQLKSLLAPALGSRNETLLRPGTGGLLGGLLGRGGTSGLLSLAGLI